MTTKAKNTKLRHNEYYGQQSTLDELYEKSLNDVKFKKLYERIIEEGNILLAYRNIKANTGSKTKGTDGKTIKDIAAMTNEQVIQMVRDRLKKYIPQAVRRVEIKKDNGKMRSLGIPTILDRVYQNVARLALEPQWEARFNPTSYGFSRKSLHDTSAFFSSRRCSKP